MATSQSGDRMFLIGETIHFRARISTPGTRAPVDASTVALTSLRLNGVPVTPAITTFSRAAQGDYLLVLPSVGMAAGSYDVVITVSSGPSAVSIIKDRFALQAP